MELQGITVSAWLLLALGAALVGVAKTSLPGAGILPVAIFAAVLPARISTGVLLVVLIAADIFAVALYRAHADWALLRRLVPSVAAGVVLGSVLLAMVNDGILGRAIGVLLVVLVAVGLRNWIRNRSVGDGGIGPAPPTRVSPWKSSLYGSLAGTATMAANSAGPRMSLYFLASGLSVRALLGTSAWFYFVINLVKLPFSVGLGLITTNGLLMSLSLIPAMILGGLLGSVVIKRVNVAIFEVLLMTVTMLAGLLLIIR
jgi:uncharacterized membrane protein YfcA